MAKRKKNTLIMITVIVVSILFVSSTCFSLTIKDSIKLYDRGKREYKRGDYNDAIDYFNKAINDCPESSMTEASMYFLGKSYQQAGNAKMATDTFKQLVDKYKSSKWANWAKQELKK